MRILFSPLLFPLSLLFCAVSFLRARMYDLGVLRSYPVSSKVICVGNLTSGGTGKTPLIRWLAQEFQKRGKRVAVLSRGYKRSSSQILKVNPSSNDFSKYGDEPLQLSRQLRGTSVYVGSDRLMAAHEIVQAEMPDVILLDDGFQHRRLRRDLDFVVMDPTQPHWMYWPLPLGLGREGRWALKRASAVMLTKTNLAKVSDIEKLKLQDFKVFEFTSSLSRCRTLDGEIWGLDRLKGERVVLLSALGNPASFEKLVRLHNINIVFHKVFPDHHQFRKGDIANFLRAADKVEADRILITEKDAVKLSGFSFVKGKVLVAELEISLKSGKEDFDKFVGRIFS